MVLRQVLEHISDLGGFGLALNNLLFEEGLLIIEVPDSRVNSGNLDYAPWEEHVNCFNPQQTDKFLASHGFRTIHYHALTFSGVCLTNFAKKIARTGDELILVPQINWEALSQEVKQFRECSRCFSLFRDAVHDEVQQFVNPGDVILYVLRSRSSNFAIILGSGSSIACAVDHQPEKQFKHTPHQGLEIPSSWPHAAATPS